MQGQWTSASGGPRWVVLDAALHRQGELSSIERQGPWVQFTQSFAEMQDGKPAADALLERMAVNCLTGAYGQTRYPATDPHTNQRMMKQQSLSEIEHAQDLAGRLQLADNSTALGRALIEFACTCPAAPSGWLPTQTEVQAMYEHYIEEPLTKVDYHLKFLRVKSRQIAVRAIGKLAASEPFETVFDRYASASDANSFPHGDLGWHLETDFPMEDVRRFRELGVGQISRVPHDGLYGWEIEKLEARRTIPAPSLPSMQPRLQQYLARAHDCGWTP